MMDGMRARCVRSWVGAAALLAAPPATPALAITPTAPALAIASATPAGGDPAQAAHDPTHCARPALWVVGDHDTTIYLFGTIHTHDGVAHWFDHAVRRAFDASDDLVLETIVPSAPLPVGGPPPGSGLAAARQTVRAAGALGMRVELGADLVLHRAATRAGKPVIGLESFESQINMYRSLPSPARPAAPAAAPAALSTSQEQLGPFLRTMIDSWNRGDSGPIETVVGAVRLQSPEAYRRLFTDRNAAWARWIEARLARPGTVFVAVGTGHLVGSDSVQSKLSQAGIASARVN